MLCDTDIVTSYSSGIDHKVSIQFFKQFVFTGSIVSLQPVMSRLFRLGDDSLRILLSLLDIRSICYLDIAVGNVGERLLWLHSLQRMDCQAVDEYEHSDSSIRWLIMRGARTTMIRIRRNRKDLITDETFVGIGIHYVPTVSRSKKLASILRNVFGRVFCLNLRSCNISHLTGTAKIDTFQMMTAMYSDIYASIGTICDIATP